MYEIFHYRKDFTNADKAINEYEEIVEVYDLTKQRNKLAFLKDNGTIHERLKSMLEGVFSAVDAKKNEWEELVTEMTKMDEEERKVKEKPLNDNFHIQLFPIGYFQFPKTETSKVYDILNIEQEARKVFDDLFGLVFPIANIFYNPIPKEGFIDGILADEGIENWRNIYRIRKMFYENKFYRFEHTVPKW